LLNHLHTKQVHFPLIPNSGCEPGLGPMERAFLEQEPVMLGQTILPKEVPDGEAVLLLLPYGAGLHWFVTHPQPLGISRVRKPSPDHLADLRSRPLRRSGCKTSLFRRIDQLAEYPEITCSLR